jgi:hypothetical protein
LRLLPHCLREKKSFEMIRNERKKNKKNKNEDDDALKLAFVLSSASFQEAPFDSSLSSSSFFLSQRRRRGGRENEKPLLTFSSSLSSSSSSFNWKEIREKARERTDKDSACAICREEFATTIQTSATTTMDDDQNRGQVLTSCAHCFHAQCLKSFERFVESISERRRCPCCRAVGYRKIRISDARDECIRHAALTIQKMWRGRLVRNKLGPTNENARMTWMANKLRALRKRVERSAEKRRETRKQQLAEEEEEEDIDESFSSDEDSNDTNTDWNVVIAQSLSLENDECSICALRFAASKTNAGISSQRTDDSSPLSPPTTTKVAYLSCSHRFHRNCLRTFERHLKSIGREIFCPCCRQANYSRKCL